MLDIVSQPFQPLDVITKIHVDKIDTSNATFFTFRKF